MQLRLLNYSWIAVSKNQFSSQMILARRQLESENSFLKRSTQFAPISLARINEHFLFLIFLECRFYRIPRGVAQPANV